MMSAMFMGLMSVLPNHVWIADQRRSFDGSGRTSARPRKLAVGKMAGQNREKLPGGSENIPTRLWVTILTRAGGGRVLSGAGTCDRGWPDPESLRPRREMHRLRGWTPEL